MKYHETSINALLGKRIRTLRLKSNFTQEQLAEALELPRTTITNIESGGQRISVFLIFEIARIFNVNLSEILPSADELDRQSTKQLPPETARFVREFMEDEL